MPRPNPIQRARALGVSRGVGMSLPASGIPEGRQIVSITDEGGTTKVTTVGAHGLIGFENIIISGNSVPGYNTTTQTISELDPTSFLCDLVWTEDGTGGSWALV